MCPYMQGIYEPKSTDFYDSVKLDDYPLGHCVKDWFCICMMMQEMTVLNGWFIKIVLDVPQQLQRWHSTSVNEVIDIALRYNTIGR